ncbi:uncharacterized protein LOC129571476, partial [Sitodiplosis mosellana]|uniref:uncharacterized protein LOC129571476 n=1 Tax=Sitodiplosis mosellana TaxID=263140 RepID=UPI00244484D3
QKQKHRNGKVLNEATEICERISIEVEFDHQKRRAARTTVTNAEEFETKVFLPIIESATDSVTDRFKALKQHSELFSFLYDFENYEANRNNGSLQKSCKKLEIALTHDGKSDIDGDDLFVELSLVSSLVNQDNIIHAIDILNSIQKRKMENLVPNAVIALRILLTIPVSVLTGERSFSKL